MPCRRHPTTIFLSGGVVLQFACLQHLLVPAATSGFNLLSVLEGKVDADQQQRHKRPHGFALSGSNDSLHSAGKIKAAAPLHTATAFTRSDCSPARACLVSTSDAAQGSELRIQELQHMTAGIQGHGADSITHRVTTPSSNCLISF